MHSQRQRGPRAAAVLLRLVLAVAVAAGVLGASGTTHPVAAATPLPACRYADVLTKYRGLTEWYKTLLDTIYRLPSTYAPTTLKSTSYAGLNGGYLIRGGILPDLKAMASAARAAGARLAVQSAYRSYATQKIVFQREIEMYGYATALTQSARPGHSEHQLGSTLDFRSYYSTKLPWDYADWGTTKAGLWLAANAWKYGFLMTYPKGKSTVTCYTYEPWHYRYVGRPMAKAVRDSGLTLREYQWRRWGSAG